MKAKHPSWTVYCFGVAFACASFACASPQVDEPKPPALASAQPTCPSDQSAATCPPAVCDPSELRETQVAPPGPCPEFFVHSIVDGAYGPCVPIERCPCGSEAACPDEAHFVCHKHIGRCGPYVR